MTNRPVCTISMNMGQKTPVIPSLESSEGLRMVKMSAECGILAMPQPISGVVRRHVQQKFRKTGTSCTTSYWPAICISGPDIPKQITHRKPAIEEAFCLVNIDRKWVISLVPVGAKKESL